MKLKKQAYDSCTMVEEIEVIYDTSMTVGFYPTHTMVLEISNEFTIPETNGYAVATGVDRERAKRTYPGPSRAGTPPVGEDLDVL